MLDKIHFKTESDIIACLEHPEKSSWRINIIVTHFNGQGTFEYQLFI